MKHAIYTILFFLLITLVTPAVYAQTPTTSETATKSAATTAPIDESEMKNVKKIIDLVASKSAEQKLAEKVGILGTVAQKTNTTITLKSISGDNKIIDIDEITKFTDPNSKTFGISDIKAGNVLGIVGILNKVSEHVLARFINKPDSIPTYFEGVITEVDPKNFQYTAVDENGNKQILDIITSSKIYSFSQADGQIKSGFSKTKVGERVYAAGFTDKKDASLLSISRLTHFVDVVPSEKMKKYLTVTPEDTATPTAKITPKN